MYDAAAVRFLSHRLGTSYLQRPMHCTLHSPPACPQQVIVPLPACPSPARRTSIEGVCLQRRCPPTVGTVLPAWLRS